MATAKSKAARTRPTVSAKKRAEASGGFEGTTVNLPAGINFFKVERAGNIRIDVIPYLVPDSSPAGPNPDSDPGTWDYTRTFYAHRGIGPNGNMYVCPARTAGKKCPICEHRHQLDKDGGDPDLIKDLLPKKRQLYYVFDHEDAARGLQLWEISYHLFGKQLEKEVKAADEEDKYEFFADPDEGFTLRVGMDQESFSGNTFYSAGTIAFKERVQPISDNLLEVSEANPLDNLLIVLPYEKLKALYLQTDDGEGEEEQEEEEATPAPTTKARTRAPKTDKKPEAKPKDKAAPKTDKKPAAKTKAPAAPTAESLGIEKGDEVTFADTLCTVFKITDDGLTVTLVDDEDDIYKGVKVGRLTLGAPAQEEEESTQEEVEQDEPDAGEEAEPAADASGEWDDDWD